MEAQAHTQRLVCNICHKKFQYPGLMIHMKVHTRTNLILCLHCPLKFTTNKAMKNHAKKHLVAWIKCVYCSESFETKYNKNPHEGLMDLGGKPHVGTSVSGQENYGHTKKVVQNVKIYPVSSN